MQALKPIDDPVPPCLHPMPRAEKLIWLVIWVVVAATVFTINIAQRGHPSNAVPTISNQ